MTKFSKHILRGLGLTENQTAVYFAALELGQATVQDLARKSGVKRTSIYNFIDELKERQLLTETKKRRRGLYAAAHPQQLIEMERTRIKELEDALPELLSIHNKSRKRPRVTFYEGVSGIQDVYGDMLKDKKEILAWEDLEHMKIALPPSFYEYFPAERARRGITFKSILRDSSVAHEMVKRQVGLLRESKFIQTGDLKTEINIYSNKVALMSFRSDPPFAVLIEDPSIAETLRVAWTELWNRL